MRSSIIQPPGKRVVIVDIDERSLMTLGQWPWRRDVIGRLITRLRDMGASVIGLDIIFAEADRLEMPDPAPRARDSRQTMFSPACFGKGGCCSAMA